MKGRAGCFRCGKPTAHIVQVWLREYIEGSADKGRTRKQRSIDSIVRHCCQSCATDVADIAVAALARHNTAWHGCALCGVRATNRIQVWVRALGGKSVRSKSSCYCEACSDHVYGQACAPLDPGTYRCSEAAHHNDSGGLAAARAVLHGRPRP